MSIKYEKLVPVSLVVHPDVDEQWVKDRIKEDPAILNLGSEIFVKDVERIQKGRLDLLLQEADGVGRYEVEVQLGDTDPSHIIRTIEYWDIERKRYPQYEHTAVLIAENITSRFFNVIGLFNGAIPLIAIQMSAFEWEGKLGLHFTKVLDVMPLGLVGEDEEVQEPVDRAYWEKQRGNKISMALTDELLQLINTSLDGRYELGFVRSYIGLTQDGRARNFVAFKPQKSGRVRVEAHAPRETTTDTLLDESGLNYVGYNTRGRYYAISVGIDDVKGDETRKTLVDLFQKCADAYGSIGVS